MSGIWAILKKDFSSCYRSWVGTLVLSAFLLIAGIFFTLFLLSYSQFSLTAAREAYKEIQGLSLTAFIMGAFLLNLGVFFLFLAPLLSMRSIAEEKRFGTLELLYTYPLSDFEIVAGKYLSLLAQVAILFLPTLSYALVIHWLGAHLDMGIIGSGTIGFFLLTASFLAGGLYFSSLTENQILAGGLTFTFLLVLWVLEWLAGFLPGPLSVQVSALSPFVHFRDFSMGIVDLTDVTYFLAFIAFFFFLTLRRIEMRNWKA